MNPRAARRLLSTHLEDPNVAAPAAIQSALKDLEGSSDLLAEYNAQLDTDKQVQSLLAEVQVPDEAIAVLVGKIKSTPTRYFNPRDPAMLSVLIGFLLLIAVLTWNFLGRPAAFPSDALGIAEEFLKPREQTFEAVGQPAGSLEDWFVLKGFDGFRVPSRLKNYIAAEAAILKLDNQMVAVVTVPEQNAQFLVFSGKPLGIEITPHGTWRSTQLDLENAIALREENGMCFMIIKRGSLENLEYFLRQDLE
jgi:hypothetical protein